MLKFNHYVYTKDGITYDKAVCNTSFGRVVGIAACQATDAYDEEFGRKLSEAKCFKKVKELDVKELAAKWDCLERETTAQVKKMVKLEDKLEKEEANLLEAIRQLNNLLTEEKNKAL